MASDNSAQQKSEKPTRRRRRQAREKGQVAQSAEVNSTLVLLAALGALVLFGGRTFDVMGGLVSELLGGLHQYTLDLTGTRTLMSTAARNAVTAVAPIMLLTGVMGLLCSLAQTGILFAPRVIAPDLQHVDPIRGAKNILSLSAVMRLLVAVVKMTAIGLVVYFLVRSRISWLAALTGKSVWGILEVTRRICFLLLVRVLLVMMVVAALDYAFQKWRFEKQLMMSKTELRDEYKRDEGDPGVRGRQAHARRALARNRMMQAVPAADVVVTNPTHVAVALQWDEREMAAPRVVAKGRDLLAGRIKELAREHGVPVVERKILAHTLYQAVEVGMDIPPKLYYAVAEVLAFVMRRRRSA